MSSAPNRAASVTNRSACARFASMPPAHMTVELLQREGTFETAGGVHDIRTFVQSADAQTEGAPPMVLGRLALRSLRTERPRAGANTLQEFEPAHTHESRSDGQRDVV